MSGPRPDTGETVELALDEVHHGVPATPAGDLRDELPGLEPDRRLDDWGRSQRVEALIDRSLGGFLYHYWFRVETEGIENVPARGGALLVANRAGALPADGLMVAKAVREEHRARRRLYLAGEGAFRSVPGVGMVATKVGAVTAHPANLQRLLFDEGQLALLFPEGRQGSRKSLRERYRLRPFDPAFVVAAASAGVPIVPLAALGTEEATPVLGRLRVPNLPLTPALPLPAKLRIRFLEPVPAVDVPDPERLADQIRALIQENLLEMVAARRSVWLG